MHYYYHPASIQASYLDWYLRKPSAKQINILSCPSGIAGSSS